MSALLTGASGLIAHQALLDVVGHNIANINTSGFKAQRAHFSDLYYDTLSHASSPRTDGRGGTNPVQIGRGVQISHIDRDFSPGSADDTGQQFDMSIDGPGFFVVSDGTSNFYTRVGAFRPDRDGVLVDPNGLEVQRVPFIGEGTGAGVGFQIPGDSSIRIPQDALIPPEATSEITIRGNLSEAVTIPSPTVRTTFTPLQDADGLATEISLLNDLQTNHRGYGNSDQIYITGRDTDGEPINDVFSVSSATSLGDLIDKINEVANGFEAKLRNGNIVLVAFENGPSDFSLKLRDAVSNEGSTEFLMHGFDHRVTKGTKQGSVALTTKVFDPRGKEHEVDLKFERLEQGKWRMTASIDPSVGDIENSVIEPIEFTEDGNLESILDKSIAIRLNGYDNLQYVRLSFDNPTTLQLATNQAEENTLAADGNGYPPSKVTAIRIDGSGAVIGLDADDREMVIAQMAIASFQNVSGLEAVKDSLFASSLNSGEPLIGGGGSFVRQGSLESSNVDVAYEFTRLIVAQRGFSANARTITVASEVLEELTNIIR